MRDKSKNTNKDEALTRAVLGGHVGDEKIDCDQAWGHFDCPTLPSEAIWAII